MALKLKFDEYDWPLANEDWKPFNHQINTTKFLIVNKRAYVLNELGTGKTMSALWATDFLLRNQVINKVLIVSPLSTLGSVWYDSIRQNLGNKSVGVAHGPKAKRQNVIRQQFEYTIINHDGIKILVDDLLAQKYDVIIIDELTAFKTYSTDRSKAMRKIAKAAKAVWGLTGNVTPNKPTEAFGQAKVVNPDHPNVPRYFTKFRDLVEFEVAPRIWVPKDGSQHEVYKILQPAVRYKLDNCVDIPELNRITVDIELSDDQNKAYNDVKKELMHEYQNDMITASNAGVKLFKLLQISTGWVKSDSGEVIELNSKPRLDKLLEIFNELTTKKLVIFTSFRASVIGVTEFLKKKGIKAEHIYGSTPQDVRANLIRQFQGSDLEVLVIQPRAASHGITLTASNTIVWHGLDMSGETVSQANGRISRIGQTRVQNIFSFVGSPAEGHVLKLLTDKHSRSHEVLDLFKEIVFQN